MFKCEALFIVYKNGDYELIFIDNEDSIISLIIGCFDLIERIFEI